ncbi:hypothetical protein AVEN_222627-1 [Araneus ventricosus]|uniref:Uncharacterized protein n=1 Tax=Araneus ventricosus TaxID=182803 RepID=A0A4Y2KGX2_ARAVE|nr:hypothetical protein AVEN_222627-1 [Araneus ventricosus]
MTSHFPNPLRRGSGRHSDWSADIRNRYVALFAPIGNWIVPRFHKIMSERWIWMRRSNGCVFYFFLLIPLEMLRGWAQIAFFSRAIFQSRASERESRVKDIGVSQ